MRKIGSLFVAASLGFASPALATNGMRMIGFGPVQNSMGGASVATPLDAATVVSNPAGLLAVGHRLDVGGTYFSPTVKYDATQVGPGGSSTAGLQSDFGASYIPTLGYAIPLSDQLATGVALCGAAGMGVDYGQNLYGGVTKTSYLQARLAPGVAYKLAEGLTAGLTVNAMLARMSYDVAGGMGMPERKTASSLGIGAVVGLQYAVSPAITLGAAYETESFFQDFEFDIPAHTQVVDPGTGATFDFPGGKEKLAFNQPPVATVGVAVRPVEGLVLALDGEYIFWSQTNGKDAPKISNGEATGAMPFNMDWSDQAVVKVGAEYAATSAVRLRAGYNYGKSPLNADRAFENIAFPAIAEHHLTAGVGVQLARWTVNATAMYVPEAKLTGANAAQQGIATYTTKMSQLQIDLGGSYRF
jgi:long-chain fatty acid transport protein